VLDVRGQQGIPMNDVDKKNREKKYAETRKDLLTRQLSNSEKFDGAILTLSTAALGVSLTFIKDIVPLSLVQNIYIIKISWWLFGFAILSTIMSFVTSQSGISKQLHYAEEYYLNEKSEFLNKKNIPATLTDIFNNLAAIFFIIALICTIIFVSTNLKGNTVMTDDDKKDDKTTETQFKEGAAIPSMQPFGAKIPNLQPHTDGDIMAKGAPIPNMEPVPDKPQETEPTEKPHSNEGGDQKK